MKKFLSVLYTGWCGIVFVVPFLFLYPFIFICIQNKRWHPFGHKIVRFWSQIFFLFTGMIIQKDWKFKPDKNKTYVYVANHFSYLDVAAGMNIVENYFAYVGKSSVSKVPLFGYMFDQLHIAVNREDKNSRSKTMLRGIRALKNGRSVFIMPEGGIISKQIPKMAQPFKDGPFIMALENQVSIVPISYLNNYQINPANLFKWGLPKVIINKEIKTEGKTSKDIEALKKEVYDIIQSDLDKYYGLEKTEYLG
ncbi:lysophospholipid acyltransferase family protein [Arcticibacterium luteifluviistationis]|uniref:1-acyl-sn-glycerol-3-phosphate acyltransferase n=1 Tax=Arcticibacterium luteifluviistationis TaxID=1784714 RepID=A0A2Z4GER9_9BACT|nr:lysophospholipid acyltransferase family protein [Arcticibacterium luteifluviistationis]AWV99766.1 1-acyl-sn-glycerol-3-phosphate acyltransferase [Arcticibacterium luteifluviistationis]